MSSRQARAEAERAYQPYVHDVARIGAKTGRPMPTNIPRTGPDAIESIEDFFRSPLAHAGSRTGRSFAALGDSPAGSGGGGPAAAGRSEGDWAVEEALARDADMGEDGALAASDSVEGTPSRYFRSKGLPSAPFPPASNRTSQRPATPPPAGESYAALPSPSPTRAARPRPANRPGAGSTGGRGPSSTLSMGRSDADEEEAEAAVELAARQQQHHRRRHDGGAPLARPAGAGGRHPSLAGSSRAPSSPAAAAADDDDDDDEGFDEGDSPVARSRGRGGSGGRPSSIAPDSARASTGGRWRRREGDDDDDGEVGDETVELADDTGRSDAAGEEGEGEAMDVRFDDDDDDGGQAGMAWGGGQPSSDGNDAERFDHDDGAGGYNRSEEEEEAEEEEEEEVAPSRSKKGKGKRPRVADPTDDEAEDEVEDDAAAEEMLLANDDDDDDDNDDNDDGVRPAAAAAKTKGGGGGRQGKPAPKRAKLPTTTTTTAAAGAETFAKARPYGPRTAAVAIQPRIVPLHDSDRTSDSDDASGGGGGSRRSKRQRFRPLEYWRGEKLIFGRGAAGRSAVPVVKAVQELPPQEVVPYGQPHPRKKARAGANKGPAAAAAGPAAKRGGGKAGGRSATLAAEPAAEPEEAGWDRDTLEHGVVFDYTTKQEIERRIAFPAHLLEYRTMSSDPNGFKFQKVFGDASFVAAGMLEIPVDGEKPSKPTKDNTYLFYVIEGAVNVKIHRTSFTMAVGGQFMVPRGNQYSIHTISRRPAKLFFAQARRMASDEEDVPSVLTASQAPPAGAPVAGKSTGPAKRK